MESNKLKIPKDLKGKELSKFLKENKDKLIKDKKNGVITKQ